MYITKWIKGAYFPYVSRPDELRNYCVSNKFGNITMEQQYKIKGQKLNNNILEKIGITLEIYE